jgi:hypothetical protein
LKNTYALYSVSANGSTYEKITDKFRVDESRFISLVFPYANKVIDQISIDFAEGKDIIDNYKKINFEIKVDMDYTLLKPFQLRQRPCVFIDNLQIICSDYLYEDEYNCAQNRNAKS